MSFNKPTFPGVYTRLVAEGPRTIAGVSTSITVFVGKTKRGPISPTRIFNWLEFERIFGGIWIKSKLGYAVQDYFLNGGTEAIICRVFSKIPLDNDINITNLDGRTKFSLENMFTLIARDPGDWSIYDIEIQVDNILKQENRSDHINLEIHDKGRNIKETFRNLSLVEGNKDYIVDVLKSSSNLLRIESISSSSIDPKPFLRLYRYDLGESGKQRTEAGESLFSSLKESGIFKDISEEAPADSPDTDMSNLDEADTESYDQLISFLGVISTDNQGNDGKEFLDDADVMGIRTDPQGANLLDDLDIDGEKVRMGLSVLDTVDLFNIVCIPPYNKEDNTPKDVYGNALQICDKRRAFLLIDSRSTQTWNDLLKNSSQLLPSPHRNSAVFFPRVKKKDPSDDYKIKEYVPCGIIAGIMARTDANVGVWKAPAGYEAGIRGIAGLAMNLTDQQNGVLNIKGINCLMSKAVIGPVVWGARTRRGADELADPWRYIPVIRTALFIEESLYRGTQWVVFEPNDEPLWSQIRLSIGGFMHSLFRKGAFQGTSPKEAYFVKCDKETTTEYDRNNGIVNIIVGFAPLKPAEFVLLTIQQISEVPQ
ncbi:MAG: phage tail sheath family protein [Candidatus Nitrosocosmicus sp.]